MELNYEYQCDNGHNIQKDKPTHKLLAYEKFCPYCQSPTNSIESNIYELCLCCMNRLEDIDMRICGKCKEVV